MDAPTKPPSSAHMVNADRTPTDFYFRLIVALIDYVRHLEARIAALEP